MWSSTVRVLVGVSVVPIPVCSMVIGRSSR